MITVGWLLTNLVNGLLAIIIRPMEITTAIIMTDKCSTMPTAVITASRENTASSTTICATIGQNMAYTAFDLRSATWPSNRSCNSIVALNNRNRPPNSMIKSRPEKDFSNTSNNGSVSVTIHEMLASRPKRINRASVRPITRARSRCSGGSLSARMAINTRLSMPSTNSSTIKVNRPSQAVGSAIHSISVIQPLETSGSTNDAHKHAKQRAYCPCPINLGNAWEIQGWRLSAKRMRGARKNWEAPGGCSYRP